MNAILLVIVLCVLSAGCVRKEVSVIFHDDPRVGELTFEEQRSRLARAEAASDAKLAFSREDYRFIGAQGIGLDIPGLDVQYPDKSQIRIKVIAGVSDMPINNDHEEMIRLARKYARDYNTALLVLLSNSGQPKDL